MIDITIIIIILVTHWVGDFILQTNYMAQNKSKKNGPLTLHVFLYSIPFFIIFNIEYAIINGIVHWCIDWVTARITSKLFKQQKIHEFFVVIGLDQTLHFITLFGTYYGMSLKGWI